ncbi:MAG: PDZ domain-containing protein [Chloroflexi bacterium]|nr:PDZ domain-containing protein [Chloroflexota bacterium]
MIRGIVRIALMTIFAMILVGGAFLGGFATSRQVFPPAPSPDGGAPAEWKTNIPVFWEAWKYVHQDFYKAPDDTELSYGAVYGMVESLGDQHTRFVDAKRAQVVDAGLTGSFEGIGATVEMREGRLTVVAPITGSPAEKAGIVAGDVIIKVNDTVIQNMDVNQAIAIIRGPKGTSVRLTIQRAKQSNFELTIIRDRINVPSVTSKMIEGTKIAYLRLSEFSAPAPEEMRQHLTALMAQKPAGLIFDLRSNPGGYLSVAIDVASQFIKAGQPVIIVKDKNGAASKTNANPGGLAIDIPLVLLVDGGSASASEIVAAALKDYKRAMIVGVKTYGKGSVQTPQKLSDQSELHVTIAHFFSPLDHDIHEIGITPDVEIKITDDDRFNKKDPQLDKAIEILKQQTGTRSYYVPLYVELTMGI